MSLNDNKKRIMAGWNFFFLSYFCDFSYLIALRHNLWFYCFIKMFNLTTKGKDGYDRIPYDVIPELEFTKFKLTSFYFLYKFFFFR